MVNDESGELIKEVPVIGKGELESEITRSTKRSHELIPETR